MLYGSILFLAVAVIAGLFGFTEATGPALPIARVVFFAFVLLFAWSLLLRRDTSRDTAT